MSQRSKILINVKDLKNQNIDYYTPMKSFLNVLELWEKNDLYCLLFQDSFN